MNAAIYFLIDPRDGQVKYIGSTKHINKRIDQHLKDHYNHDKVAWVLDLKGVGLAPIMTIVEYTGETGRFTRERYWIRFFRRQGIPLLNRRTPMQDDISEEESDRIIRDSMSKRKIPLV